MRSQQNIVFGRLGQQAVNHNIRAQYLQLATEDLQVLLQGKDPEPVLPVKPLQGGIPKNLELVELDPVKREGVNPADCFQHLLPSFPRQAVNDVHAEVDTPGAAV